MSDGYCESCGRYIALVDKRRTVNGKTVCQNWLCAVAAEGWGEELRLGIFGTPEGIAAYREEQREQGGEPCV